ncbi:MAG: XRE family transcriptional regulator [Chitinophaga sp.]|nr:XRE family transcriptional regulator [Chitinophaga sp.]PJE47093.1 MAG: XRE family transcriptional regulator [Sediminibacterium sp.] [Sediminibacterium sp. FEMGT703S]
MFQLITINQVKTQIGELCKVLRNQAGLTQAELAELLGLSRLTIQNMEAGKNPTLDTVLKVLQHFDQLALIHNFFKEQTSLHQQPSLY